MILEISLILFFYRGQDLVEIIEEYAAGVYFDLLV
jgi:hypothetical protein